MTEIAKALHAFYSGFELPAYTEDNVPDTAELPYITYTVPQGDLFEGVSHQARVWYYGNSNVQVNEKADEIMARIGRGIKLQAGHGYICIYPGTPLAHLQPADENTRIVYINLEMRNYV